MARGTDDYASATFNRDLAALQRATARYHNFERAIDDGWVPITPCLSNPTLGAMGYHYGLPSRVDGVVSVEEPEVLLYEPKAGGGYRLVAVEYIIPFANLSATATPPTLFGQTFHQNMGAGLWALHAWVWKANPSGLFADWNPNVSCAAASP